MENIKTDRVVKYYLKLDVYVRMPIWLKLGSKVNDKVMEVSRTINWGINRVVKW